MPIVKRYGCHAACYYTSNMEKQTLQEEVSITLPLFLHSSASLNFLQNVLLELTYIGSTSVPPLAIEQKCAQTSFADRRGSSAEFWEKQTSSTSEVSVRQNTQALFDIFEDLHYVPCYMERYAKDFLVDLCPLSSVYTPHFDTIFSELQFLLSPFESELDTLRIPRSDTSFNHLISMQLFLKLCWTLFGTENDFDSLLVLKKYPNLMRGGAEFFLCKAKCLLRAGKFKEVISFLESDVDFSRVSHALTSALCLVLGECYEAVGVIQIATDHYRSSISSATPMYFPNKTENSVIHSSMLSALNRLIGKYRLSNFEERQLISMLLWNVSMSPFLHLFASRLFAPLPLMNKDFGDSDVQGDDNEVFNYFSGGYCWESGCSKNRGLNISRLKRRLSEVYYPGMRIPNALSEAVYNARLQAEYYYRRYNFETALSFCKYILAKDPFDWDTLVIKCCCMLQLPIYFHGLTKLAAALKRYHIHTSCAWFVDGCASLASSRYLKAIESFKRGLRIDPHFFECVMAIGHAHSLRGNSDNATLFYHNVARLQPLNYRAFLYLGMEELKAAECSGDDFTQLERLNRAEMYITHAHELNPDDPFVHNEFGAMANLRGRFELAMSWFTKAVESSSQICGKFSLFHSNLGYARLRFGSFKCAAKAFYMALKIDAEDYHAWLGLAVALYQLRQQNCILFFEKAMKLSYKKSEKIEILWNLVIKDFSTSTFGNEALLYPQVTTDLSENTILQENRSEGPNLNGEAFSEERYENILRKHSANSLRNDFIIESK